MLEFKALGCMHGHEGHFLLFTILLLVLVTGKLHFAKECRHTRIFLSRLLARDYEVFQPREKFLKVLLFRYAFGGSVVGETGEYSGTVVDKLCHLICRSTTRHIIEIFLHHSAERIKFPQCPGIEISRILGGRTYQLP